MILGIIILLVVILIIACVLFCILPGVLEMLMDANDEWRDVIRRIKHRWTGGNE